VNESRSISRTILSLLIATTYLLASIGSGVHEILRHGEIHTSVATLADSTGHHTAPLAITGGKTSLHADPSATCIFCASGPIVLLLPSTIVSTTLPIHSPSPVPSVVSRIFRTAHLTPSLRGPPGSA